VGTYNGRAPQGATYLGWWVVADMVKSRRNTPPGLGVNGDICWCRKHHRTSKDGTGRVLGKLIGGKEWDSGKWTFEGAPSGRNWSLGIS